MKTISLARLQKAGACIAACTAFNSILAADGHRRLAISIENANRYGDQILPVWFSWAAYRFLPVKAQCSFQRTRISIRSRFQKNNSHWGWYSADCTPEERDYYVPNEYTRKYRRAVARAFVRAVLKAYRAKG